MQPSPTSSAPPDELELTIAILCRNEEGSIAHCVGEARRFIERKGIRGEAMVVDNGSGDRSAALAKDAGARVVSEPNPGYGNAVRAGIDNARGKYIIIGDGDGQHNLNALDTHFQLLQDGYEFVVGNRLADGLNARGLPFLGRSLGSMALSGLGMLLYRTSVSDYNCGLRGMRTAAARALDLRCPGMEASSEMIVKAARMNLRMAEAPISERDPLDPGRDSHLRMWRDGWRHLRLLLMMSPRWLYLYPGCALLIAGLAAMLAAIAYPGRQGGVFGVYTMLFGAAFAVCGTQMVIFSSLASAFCENIGLTKGNWTERLQSGRVMNGGLVAGAAMAAMGAAGSVWSLFIWAQTGGPDIELRMSVAIPSVALLICGMQLAFSSFFLALLAMQGAMRRRAPDDGGHSS